MKIIRQGDVLLISADAIPKGAKKQKPEGGRVVLAHGEVTGHAHAIYTPAIAALYGEGLDRFLKVQERATLSHEEHTAAIMEPGIYRVIIQTEYTPEELRNVAD